MNDVCWGWRKILQSRDILREHIVYRIGDGSQTSLWYDNWLFFGPLSQFIIKRDVFEADFSLDCKVCDMVENGEWKWCVEEEIPVLVSSASSAYYPWKEG